MFVRLEFYDGIYFASESSCREAGILGAFLGADLRCTQNTWFTDWIDGGKLYGICSNATTVELTDEGDIIEIRDLLDEEAGAVFRMPKDQYIKMVHAWQELCKKKPKEIIVTWDGKEISVEGRD